MSTVDQPRPSERDVRSMGQSYVPPIDWSPDRDARGRSRSRSPRCPERGCEVRYASGPDRPCPDHRRQDAAVNAGVYVWHGDARQAGLTRLRKRTPPPPPPVVTIRAGLATAAARAHGPCVTVMLGRVFVSLWDDSLLPLADAPHRTHNDRRCAARLALEQDWERSDNEIARAIGSGNRMVRRVRAELEAIGEIPPWRPDGPGPFPWQGQMARAELLKDPYRSNLVIGAVIGSRDMVVARMRLKLEAAGAIDRWRGPGSPIGYRRTSVSCEVRPVLIRLLKKTQGRPGPRE